MDNMNNIKDITEQTQQKPLRMWPGVVLVILQWLVRFGLPVLLPDAIAVGIFGGLFLGLVIVIWCAFFSRAPRFERWFAVVLMITALTATSQILHKSMEDKFYYWPIRISLTFRFNVNYPTADI